MAEELAEADWPPEVRSQIEELRLYRSVIPESVRVVTAHPLPDSLTVSFDFLVSKPFDGSELINATEPIELRWWSRGDVGYRAPSVFSGRDDFPDDLPHLNPVPEGQNACFCLALAGNDSIYQLTGLTGLLHRLENWLTSAVNETLAYPEWHPEPLLQGGDGGLSVTFIDVSRFQERAERLSPGDFVCGVYVALHEFAQTATNITDRHVVDSNEEILSGESPLASKLNFYNSRVLPDAENLWYGPWILLRIPEPSSKTIFRPVDSLQGLYRSLSKVGSHENLKEALEMLKDGGIDGRRRTLHDKSVLLFLAVERPTPIMSEIVGLSESPGASNIEIVGYQIVAGTQNPLFHEDNRVIRSRLLPSLRPNHYRRISDVDSFPKLLVVGCGAVGSNIFDNLLRAGAEDLVIIDNGTIQSHNLARHRATVSDISRDKVSWAINFAQKLYFPDHIDLEKPETESINLRGISGDITRQDDDKLNELVEGCSVVIDASADPLVRETLSINECFSDLARVRVEIFDRGRLGLFSFCPRSSDCDLTDLYAWTCVQAAGASPNEEIRDWLKRERQGDISLEDLAIGLGCGSATTRLPNWVVTQHASAFMPTIKRSTIETEAEACVGVNAINDLGEPLGLSWLPPPKFERAELTDGWDVLVADSAFETIKMARDKALPNETGGYLFGIWRQNAKRLTVVFATPAPPGTSGSPASLTLAEAERCPVIKMIRRRTAGRIHLIGTWHSHPGSSAFPSFTDLITIGGAATENAKKGWPTLMLIISSGNKLCFNFGFSSIDR